jgi:DnaJ-class molecular chaperone
VIAVEGEGMPIRGSRGQFGHLFVTLTIDFPKQLTEQQKAQIKQVLA